MQIVIDISELAIAGVKFGFGRRFREEIETAIINGIPLPKGHGDLIDRKKLYDGPHFVMKGNATVGDKDYGMQEFDMFLRQDIERQEPIIPADKEGD